jgi:hypothetical protein
LKDDNEPINIYINQDNKSYFPPEFITGHKNYLKAFDIWTLGAIFLKVLE